MDSSPHVATLSKDEVEDLSSILRLDKSDKAKELAEIIESRAEAGKVVTAFTPTSASLVLVALARFRSALNETGDIRGVRHVRAIESIFADALDDEALTTELPLSEVQKTENPVQRIADTFEVLSAVIAEHLAHLQAKNH